MADLTINKRDYIDSTNSQIITVAPLVTLDIDGKTVVACQSSRLNLTWLKDLNFFELSIDAKNIYKYTQGDTFSGGSVADAEAMYLAVIGVIS
jgi:hypothetical protein